MEVGDEVFFWERRRGIPVPLLVIGKIRDMDNAWARVVALDNAPRGYGVRTVKLERLKPLAELPPRKNSRL